MGATAGARHPLPSSFRLLLTTWAASLTGDGLRVVALPLLAAATVSTPGAVATVAAFTALPWLLIAVWAGAVVDRLNPAVVLVAAHTARAVLTLLLVGAVLGGVVSIPLLCALGFAITSAETFADGAAQTLVVELVPESALEVANARFVTIETIALDLVGPLSAGVLFMVTPWLPFAVSAVCSGLAAVGVLPLIGAAAATTLGRASSGATPQARPVRSALLSVREGLSRLSGDNVLRVLVITVAVMAIGNAATDGVLVLYAKDTLGLSDALYPTLLGAYSVGTLIAAVLVGRLAARFAGGRLMLVALVGIGSTMLFMGLFPHPVVAWACYGVMGLAGGTWNVLSATRRQRRSPRAMIARVSSAFRVIAWGVIPIGNAAGGAIGQTWGLPQVFFVAGLVILVLGIVVARHFVTVEPESVLASGQAGAAPWDDAGPDEMGPDSHAAAE